MSWTRYSLPLSIIFVRMTYAFGCKNADVKSSPYNALPSRGVTMSASGPLPEPTHAVLSTPATTFSPLSHSHGPRTLGGWGGGGAEADSHLADGRSGFIGPSATARLALPGAGGTNQIGLASQPVYCIGWIKLNKPVLRKTGASRSSGIGTSWFACLLW